MKKFITLCFIVSPLLGMGLYTGDFHGAAPMSVPAVHADDVEELKRADHIVHMMWLADSPEKQRDIDVAVSKAYEWAQLDKTIHIIVWHNNPQRGDTSFPREYDTSKMVTIRHVSALCKQASSMISTLPCNISRKNENLANDLTAVLPNLLGDQAQKVNIYPQCDLAKILMMYYQAEKYPKKGFMCADLTIRPHVVSELWNAYQEDLNRTGLVMANMAFPKSLKERQTMIDDNPNINVEGGTILASTAPGFENSAFLANCTHEIMLSVLGATLLRPLASKVIDAEALNSDPECLFLLMKGSFFYLNLATREDKNLSLVDNQQLFSACGDDLIQRALLLQGQQGWKSHVGTDDKAPVQLKGNLLKKYQEKNLLNAAVVETVMRGGFVQDILTGEIIMKTLCSYNEDYSSWADDQVLIGQNASWYKIGHLKCLSVPIMDKHTLLTKESHFTKQRPFEKL